jgi:hypothetical protein
MARSTAVLFGVLLVAFAPLFFFKYSYHNDLGYWVGLPGSGYYESEHLVLVGRPVGAALLNLQTAFVRLFSSIYVLTFLRLVSLGLVAFLGAMLNRVLIEKTSLSRLQRIAFIGAMLLQPSWLLTVMWTTNLIPGAYAYVAGLGAAVALDRGQQSGPRRWIIPTVLLAISLYCYPPGAVSFFWIPLIHASLGNTKYQIRTFANAFGFFALVSLVCGVIQIFLFRPMICGGNRCRTWATDGVLYSLQPVEDFVRKSSVLMDSLATTVASWANFGVNPTTHPSLELAAMLALAIAIGVIAMRQRRQVGTPLIVTVVLIVAILVLLNAANLVSKFSVVAFRTVSPNTILVGITLVVITDYPGRMRKPAIGVVLVAFALCAFATAYHFAGYYAKGWSALTTSTQTRYGCDEDPIGVATMSDPTLARFLQPQQSGVAINDFGYEVFLPWALRGRCKVISPL